MSGARHDPLTVLRIQNIYPGSRIRIFSIRDPGSASASKNSNILTQKIVSKLSEIWSRMFISDPDPGSEPWVFTHPGSRIRESKRLRIPDSESGSATLPTKHENYSRQKRLSKYPVVKWQFVEIWSFKKICRCVSVEKCSIYQTVVTKPAKRNACIWPYSKLVSNTWPLIDS